MSGCRFGVTAALLAVAVLGVCSASAFAQGMGGEDEGEAKKETICGACAVQKNDKDEVTGATITVGEGEKAVTYHVMWDEAGMKVAELNGEMVEATGVVSENKEDKTLWITVESCKKVEKKEEGK